MIKYLTISIFLVAISLATVSKPTSEMTDSTIKNGQFILLGIWRNYITKVDGPRCGFRPTCAEYARQAIKKYGYAKGVVMGSERLQRCHSCHNFSIYDVTKEGYAYDPVTKNVY